MNISGIKISEIISSGVVLFSGPVLAYLHGATWLCAGVVCATHHPVIVSFLSVHSSA